MLQSCKLIITLQEQVGMLQESDVMSTNRASKRHNGVATVGFRVTLRRCIRLKREIPQIECALHTNIMILYTMWYRAWSIVGRPAALRLQTIDSLGAHSSQGAKITHLNGAVPDSVP